MALRISGRRFLEALLNLTWMEKGDIAQRVPTPLDAFYGMINDLTAKLSALLRPGTCASALERMPVLLVQRMNSDGTV